MGWNSPTMMTSFAFTLGCLPLAKPFADSVAIESPPRERCPIHHEPG
jgi:hypothetical protein